MPLTIASWNVNSVRKRLPTVERFLRETAVDVLCLQETKVVNELFPVDALREAGFAYQALAGMKGYNGVAILSRYPLVDVQARDWCGRADCRHIEARVQTNTGPVLIQNFYIPAGGDDPDPDSNPKFAHKLAFFDELAPWLTASGRSAERAVVCGDLNVAPLESDVWSHQRLKNVITHTETERRRLTEMQAAGGWTDAVRRFVPENQPIFTWWSYRATDWRAANKGRRLDHIWVNEPLAPTLGHAAVHDETRDWPEPSDHAPVRIVLEFD